MGCKRPKVSFCRISVSLRQILSPRRESPRPECHWRPLERRLVIGGGGKDYAGLPILRASIMLVCGSGQVPAGFLVFKTCGGSRCGPRWVRLPSTPAICVRKSYYGSLGIAGVDTQIWGCERTHAHTPKSGPLHGESQRAPTIQRILVGLLCYL